MENINNWLNKLVLTYPDKTERIVYLLIFLFPIAGMSVKHWISNIFNLLVLIALFTVRKPREPLLQQEKIFLWICAAYFAMFMVSSIFNGWEQAQTYYLGTELRFLMAIPLYILVRRYSDCNIWLLRGAIVGGFFLIGQAYYDLHILGNSLALGVYSKNLTGPVAVLIGYWGIYYLWRNFKAFKYSTRIFIFLSVIASFTTAALAGSRGGYVGFIFTGLACILFFSKPRWLIANILALSVIILLLYQNSNVVSENINAATEEFQQYFQAEDQATNSISRTSTGIRLSMVKSGAILIQDNFLIGVGPGNYNKSIQAYIDKEQANPILSRYSNPHSSFLEVIIAKGILGLSTLLLLLYYPFYLFIKDYKKNKPTTVIGMIHIIGFSAFAITDHSVVVMNNYTSILLLGIIIFLSSHIMATKK